MNHVDNFMVSMKELKPMLGDMKPMFSKVTPLISKFLQKDK